MDAGKDVAIARRGNIMQCISPGLETRALGPARRRRTDRRDGPLRPFDGCRLGDVVVAVKDQFGAGQLNSGRSPS